MKIFRPAFLIGLFIMSALLVHAQRQMEYLNRGVVAVPDGQGNIFVSWRLLVTDDDKVGFNVPMRVVPTGVLGCNIVTCLEDECPEAYLFPNDKKTNSCTSSALLRIEFCP